MYGAVGGFFFFVVGRRRGGRAVRCDRVWTGDDKTIDHRPRKSLRVRQRRRSRPGPRGDEARARAHTAGIPTARTAVRIPVHYIVPHMYTGTRFTCTAGTNMRAARLPGDNHSEIYEQIIKSKLPHRNDYNNIVREICGNTSAFSPKYST